MTSPILAVEDLQVHFKIKNKSLLGRSSTLKAVDGINFTLQEGETLGVVGESGCGKSTLGRAIMRLVKPTAGRVVWQGDNIAAFDAKKMRGIRKDLQIIFQDPIASLDPRMTVGKIIAEPLRTFAPELSSSQREEKVKETMHSVGLSPEMINRYPHEFSGGQAQRIGIARAIICKPKMIVCDEPLSALDVSVQAQILKLLSELKRELGLTLVLISHDLSVVRLVSDRVLVLYLGRVVEQGSSQALFGNPRHPYTRALLQAEPIPDPQAARKLERIRLQGDPPSPINPPSGCAFRTRCLYADERCAINRPELQQVGGGNFAACIKLDDIK